MTSLFDVIEHDENHMARQMRKATVVAQARIEDQYGAWIRQDPVARVAHVSDEINAIVARACSEHSVPGSEVNIGQAIRVNYLPKVPKTAATEHESARLPKMCPFHKDVVNISLAQGDASAGFSALAPHWGGERHCESDGYKGDKCKFKPQMTTQSYWDERQERAEQRRQEREQAAELETQQQVEDTEALEEFEAPLEQELEVPATDNVVEVDFTPEAQETLGLEAEVPMSMAAKTAGDDKTGLGDAEPKMDKGKWVPKDLEGVDDSKGRNPTRHQDIAEPIKADNKSWPPKAIGEALTERVDVTQNKNDAVGTGGTFKGGPSTAVSALKPEYEEYFTNRLAETDGPRYLTEDEARAAARAADDPYAGNPILDLIENEYDGFTPQSQVDQAIAAKRP